MTLIANMGIHSDPKSLAAFGPGDARREIKEEIANWKWYWEYLVPTDIGIG